MAHSSNFIRLTFVLVSYRPNIFVEAVLRPARVLGPLLPSAPVSYATVKTKTTGPQFSDPTSNEKTIDLIGHYHKCNLSGKTALTTRLIIRRCFNGNTSWGQQSNIKENDLQRLNDREISEL